MYARVCFTLVAALFPYYRYPGSPAPKELRSGSDTCILRKATFSKEPVYQPVAHTHTHTVCIRANIVPWYSQALEVTVSGSRDTLYSQTHTTWNIKNLEPCVHHVHTAIARKDRVLIAAARTHTHTHSYTHNQVDKERLGHRERDRTSTCAHTRTHAPTHRCTHEWQSCTATDMPLKRGPARSQASVLHRRPRSHRDR